MAVCLLQDARLVYELSELRNSSALCNVMCRNEHSFLSFTLSNILDDLVRQGTLVDKQDFCPYFSCMITT